MPDSNNTSDREREASMSAEEPTTSSDLVEPTSSTSSRQFLVAEEVADTPLSKEAIGGETGSATTLQQEETSRIFPKSTMESPSKSPKWLLWVTIILVTLATVVVGAILVVRKSGSTSMVEETVSEEDASPEPTPTPEPTPALVRADLKVQVLNGSGITGKAATAKTFLEDLGYEEIKTGNASSSDYETTEISIKDSKKSYLELVTKDIKDEYTLAEEVGTLEEDDTYDVVIILGTE